MRTLYLVRHGKSSWADPRQSDFDRPLNARGERDVPFMAKLFAAKGGPVQPIVTSPAVRALTTAHLFADALDLSNGDLLQEQALYLADVPTLLRVVNALPDDRPEVMLFGHNPGLTEFVHYLTGGGPDNLPTTGMARIDLPFDSWALASRGTGELVWLDFPKRHPER